MLVHSPAVVALERVCIATCRVSRAICSELSTKVCGQRGRLATVSRHSARVQHSGCGRMQLFSIRGM
eukprot:10346022-Alexandrium_andersonii.AAC.1